MILSTARRVCVTAIKLYCGFYITSEFLIIPVLCTQASIDEKTASDKRSLVLVNRVKKHIGYLQVGDDVVIRSVTDPTKFECNKIYGLECEHVRVNDPLLSTSQLKFIPPGHVWLQSNNNGSDSRTYGPVPGGLILGHSFVKFNFKSLF